MRLNSIFHPVLYLSILFTNLACVQNLDTAQQNSRLAYIKVSGLDAKTNLKASYLRLQREGNAKPLEFTLEALEGKEKDSQVAAGTYVIELILKDAEEKILGRTRVENPDCKPHEVELVPGANEIDLVLCPGVPGEVDTGKDASKADLSIKPSILRNPTDKSFETTLLLAKDADVISGDRIQVKFSGFNKFAEKKAETEVEFLVADRSKSGLRLHLVCEETGEKTFRDAEATLPPSKLYTLKAEVMRRSSSDYGTFEGVRYHLKNCAVEPLVK